MTREEYCDRNICISNEYNGIGCEECEVTKSQEPCEDAISRQAAIDAIETTPFEDYGDYMRARELIEQLPPVTPKQKMCFDGMTNGEVIKTLFPSCKTRHENTPMDNFMEFTLDGIVGYAIEKSWWNAQYNAESEEE